MGVAGELGRRVVLPVCRRVGVLRELATYVHRRLGPHGYEHVSAQFVRNGRNSPWREDARRTLVARFEDVHAHVPAQSNPTDALIVAEALLSVAAPGDLVECGSFAGAMTAKLSIVAKMLGKRLTVFDSFEGLPAVPAHEASDYHARRTDACTWQSGSSRATLAEVSSRVERYGELSACTFVEGWFERTLTVANLPHTIAAAYTDVALASSARTCLTRLWPQLSDRGVYFSRDVALNKALAAISEPTLWTTELKTDRPMVFGAGFGLSDASPYLGFMIKGASDIDYASSLRIFKPNVL